MSAGASIEQVDRGCKHLRDQAFKRGRRRHHRARSTDVFNALNSLMWWEMLAGLRQFEADSSQIRAVLICAQGKNFCTGADLQEVKRCLSEANDLKAFLRRGHEVLMALEASPLPVVVAAHGLTLAGGIELLLAADVVFASRSARFGDQHGAFGLVPGWGGSQRLTRMVGLRRAMDLFLTARWITATEALDWGLANYVVEDDELRSAALAYCRKLCTRSASSLATMKRLARQGPSAERRAGARDIRGHSRLAG